MKVLQVIEQAFRATGEEQDDTIVWLSRSMRGAGADLHILLTSHAVSYALAKAGSPALSFGDWRQAHPADIRNDIRELLASGVEITVVQDDLEERGLGAKQCLQGIRQICRDEIATLYDSVDQVWQW
ncbi:MAG: hypothetical protein CME59_06485 [Halioglobus sp.]|nr:hypothetical protein [Halioglobus sp.]|tara:strand:- start:3680 stop:4060 length:381 start_codon:yes stop_codon:yes gene_type:complete